LASDNHRILLFGKKISGPPNLKADYCDIEVIPYPDGYQKLDRLAGYDIVILDYSAFAGGGDIGVERQEVFTKQMTSALGAGTWFCFLHYNEIAPSTFDQSIGLTNESELHALALQQIGFRCLREFSIRPTRMDNSVVNVTVNRNEFKHYTDNWGASKNVFIPFHKGEFDDVIISVGDKAALGFTISAKKGKLIYLPCQLDPARQTSNDQCISSLINALITYKTRTCVEIPDWATTSMFSGEQALLDQKAKLVEEIGQIDAELEKYQTAKNITFLAEYQFENEVPRFFRTHLGIKTEREETYKEDFWILNSAGERVAMVETKTGARGFSRKMIFSVLSRRNDYGLEDDYPSLVIVNAHRNANSFKEKHRPIDPQDYKWAAANKILVTRIEDLLYFWNSTLDGKQTSDTLLSFILKDSGWMECKPDGRVKIHK